MGPIAGRRFASPGYALMLLGCAHVVLLFAPPVVVTGYLAEAALRAGDARAARVCGRTVVGLGVVGTAVMPRSGFPVALPIGGWLLRRGSLRC